MNIKIKLESALEGLFFSLTTHLPYNMFNFTFNIYNLDLLFNLYQQNHSHTLDIIHIYL
jgi:hypothetical protein